MSEKRKQYKLSDRGQDFIQELRTSEKRFLKYVQSSDVFIEGALKENLIEEIPEENEGIEFEKIAEQDHYYKVACSKLMNYEEAEALREFLEALVEWDIKLYLADRPTNESIQRRVKLDQARSNYLKARGES